jgi:hypothetical protein
MAKSKYAKNIVSQDLLRKTRRPQQKDIFSTRMIPDGVIPEGVGFNYEMSLITAPFEWHNETHKHDFQQFLIFTGGDLTKMDEFEAVVEFSFGEEREKFVITKPTLISVPAGTYHCPLTIKKVDKPIIFIDVALNPQYKKTTSDKFPADPVSRMS